MSEFFTDAEKSVADSLRTAFQAFQACVEDAKASGLSITIRPQLGRKAADPIYDFHIVGASVQVSKTLNL